MSNNSRCNRCNKLFKNGPSKICGRQPLKNSKGSGLVKLSSTNFGPFLNTLSHINLVITNRETSERKLNWGFFASMRFNFLLYGSERHN